MWLQNPHANADEEAELFMSPKGVVEWRRLQAAETEIRIRNEIYTCAHRTCEQWKARSHADEKGLRAEQASHRQSIDQNLPNMKILDEMLTTWRQDSLSQLLECRRHLLYEEKALQLKVTQGTAIRIVSEAVCKVSIKLCRDIGQKADEQLAQLKRRLNASTLKDILEKDLNASDEMSEWLLAMVVHVLRNRSEWHANDRQKLAREVQAFLPTVSEAVRNSSIAQDARTEASSAWQAVLSGAVAGGTVGLIGGPEGVVVGAASGAAVAAVNWLLPFRM